MQNMVFLWELLKYGESQIRKVCTTLPPKSDYNYVRNPEFWVCFSVTI